MFRDFLNGRYGIDNLSLALFVLAFTFVQFRYLWIAGVLLAGYVFFRTFSKNIAKRDMELQKFKRLFGSVSRLFTRLISKFNVLRLRVKQRKHYVFVRCQKCKNTLRLPRNKGKLLVTCPACRFEFTTKT
jgi:hypothetical protein